MSPANSVIFNSGTIFLMSCVRLRNFCFSIVLLAIPATVLAGPWEVGSTNPDNAKKIKVEFAGKYTDSRNTYGVPVFEFAAPMTNDLSFEVGAGYGVIDKPQTGSRGGAKDITAKLKWRFFTETGHRPAFMLEPKFTFDTGDADSGVGGGVTTLKLPVRAGKQFGHVRLTGEVFYTHGFKHDHENILGYGGLIEYSPTGNWVIGVDLLNDRPAQEGGRYHLRSNAAIKLKVAPKIELEALVGRSIENRRGELATNVKLVAAFKF